VEVLRPRLERVQWELMAIVPRNLRLRWNAVNRSEAPMNDDIKGKELISIGFFAGKPLLLVLSKLIGMRLWISH